MTSRTPLYEPEEVTAREGTALPSTDEGPVGTPPEADQVAGRALMMAALMERSRLESSSKDKERIVQLGKWVEQHGLYGNLGASGVELFDAPAGFWTDEDVDAVGWAAFELEVMVWAMGTGPLPAIDAPLDGAALLAKLPVLGDAEAFLQKATVRDVEEIERESGLWDALLEVIRSEVYARSILEDPAALEFDEELESLLATVEARGFDRATAAKSGKPAEAVQGLRFWGRTLLEELFMDGSPHGAHKVDAAKLVSLDDATLATWLGVATQRSNALAWLLEGDEEASEPE